ncbi:YobA family protein [Bacillus thuringiensis]|uniref:YobA family protein n=1 Tax=Bacillus thuringiensis TaxID=1428 RepID=UPI0021E95E1A|nr:YobA family protein [Bacillus thuringiensis]
MNRYMKSFMFLSVFLIILSACTTKQVEKVVVKKVSEEGYVIVRNDTLFFVSDKTFETKIELQNYIEQQMNKEYPSHIVLSFKDKSAYNQLKTGDRIKVWSSQTLESYPAKMIVEKFEIVEK